MRVRERQTDTDRYRERQTNRDRDTHKHRQIRGGRDRLADREIRGESERQTDGQRERHRQRETDTDRERGGRQTDRQTDNQRQRDLEHGRVLHAHSGFTVSTHLVVTSTSEIQAASCHAPFTVNETYEWLNPSPVSLQYHSHRDSEPLSEASLLPPPASRGFSPRQHLSGDDPALNEFIRNSKLYSYGAPCVSCVLHAYVR